MRLISSKGVPKIRERQAAPSPDTSWAGALRVMSSPAPGPAGVGPALGEHPAPRWGLRTPDPPSASGSPAIPWFCVRREAALTSPPRNVALRKVEGARKAHTHASYETQKPLSPPAGSGQRSRSLQMLSHSHQGTAHAPLTCLWGHLEQGDRGGSESSPAWWHHPTGPPSTPSSRHHLSGAPCPKFWLPEVTSITTERSRKGSHMAPAGQATA